MALAENAHLSQNDIKVFKIVAKVLLGYLDNKKRPIRRAAAYAIN